MTEGEIPTRAAIGIARVLCILGIVYVHAWTGRTGEVLAQLDTSGQGMMRWVLIELVGRCAVPLLGAISGWLAAPSAARRGYAGFVRVKARTILAPMLAWNVIGLVLVSGFATWGRLKAPVPASLAEALDWIGCVTGPNPINVQISFLRDLFLCMLVAPLLARCPDRVLGAVLALAIAWTVSGADLVLLLRPQILVFFLIGLLARRHGLADRLGGWPLAAALAPYLLLIGPRIAIAIFGDAWLKTHIVAANAIDLPLRAAAALATWRLAVAAARRPLGAWLLRGERYAFLLFASHLILLWLFGPVIGLATGPLGAPAYPAFLLLQPLLALAATIGLGRALEAGAPSAARLLSGGRLAQGLPSPPGFAMERTSSGRSAQP
ncbi:acyltransferase family protein [Sphingomonas morindae]|uniref:Acyltransferase n=1 Tax=Sphingomonas morindae TaxID=1541170 RepID=A0ABY4X979_9SPHN|nr:acyltransferase [Sphingomonas morindae]USI73395.1 acyltransferase [Sphingomonas morindae]